MILRANKCCCGGMKYSTIWNESRISFHCMLISVRTLKNMNTDPSTAGCPGHRLICVLYCFDFWWFQWIVGFAYGQEGWVWIVNELWSTCSIYGEQAQFIVSLLYLWWACSIYASPKWLFDCPNSSSGSKDTVILILKSAELYSHRWPKLTLWLFKSVQWIKRYSNNDFEVSWFVQLQVILRHH